MIVAIEGMDGVGKTEIAKYISQKYNFIYIEKPVHFFYNDDKENNYADFMNISSKLYDIDDYIIKSWYFSLGNLYVARNFKNQNVVLDRHLVSNYYWNGNQECEIIFKVLIDFSGKPEITILLYASPETRIERLKNRDDKDPDLADTDILDDGLNKMVYFMNKFKLPYIIIDTEYKSIDEVKLEVDIIMDKFIVVNDNDLIKIRKKW